MLGNILLGMVVPILLAVWILRRNLKILVIYYPLGVAIASCINNVGFNYFWNILPNTRNQSFAALPMNLGIYPIAGCLMMYAIIVKDAKPWVAILVSALSLTLLEWLAKMMGHVIYFNGWNIIWTFLSYLLPFVLAYGYSKIMRYTK
ncbi:hypothetical protein QVE09_02605 [Paenibacillus sp. ClWae2A]|uniref:hypothetical protein n=1 Tax=Paenibacillus sp. ClWae2A TaxID=3057177 RepID=UPI0028F5FF2A|nr:hypothetical protein [Paenibacillus sp. ClWae2A]MDT9717773.1 hypothetical protein [Paenibacillus sp. ClWae2A]